MNLEQFSDIELQQELLRRKQKVRIECPKCKGKGQVIFKITSNSYIVCPICNGEKTVIDGYWIRS